MVNPRPIEPVRRAVQVGRVLRRAGSALLVLGVAGGVVALGTITPAQPPRDTPLPAVEVPASAVSLVCPGSVRVPTEPDGEDVAYDPQFDPTPGESTSRLRAFLEGAGTADLVTMSGEEIRSLHGTGGPQVLQDSPVEAGSVLRAEPSGDGAVVASGAVTVRTDEGDLRGIAAGPCTRPTTEAWLVGGSTALGSSARLVLQNPGRTAATVDVTLYGPSGEAELAGSPQYLVPPGEERAVLLEGVAAEQRRVVVRVAASGGLVTAHLQDSQLRGLVPAGVDHVTAGQPPALEQVVPAVSVTETAVDGVDTAQLRLLAPGDEGATARVTVLGPEGPVELPGTDRVDLAPGAVIDVPLGGLAAGVYTLLVESDEPVVAGALLTRGEGVGAEQQDLSAPLDRAWVPSVAVGAPPAPLVVPAGTRTVVAVGAVGGPADAELEVLDRDGQVLATERLSAAEGSTTVLEPRRLAPEDAEPVAAVRLRTTDPHLVWGAVLTATLEDGELVSTVTPVAPEEARGEVGVRLR